MLCATHYGQQSHLVVVGGNIHTKIIQKQLQKVTLYNECINMNLLGNVTPKLGT